MTGVQTCALPIWPKNQYIKGAYTILFSISGFLLFMLGIALCFTVIGILPGIGFMMCGAGLFIIPNFQTFQCPHCKSNITARKGIPSIKCKTCQDLIMLDWIKEEKETLKGA